jgi:hypothetical protein
MPRCDPATAGVTAKCQMTRGTSAAILQMTAKEVLTRDTHSQAATDSQMVNDPWYTRKIFTAKQLLTASVYVTRASFTASPVLTAQGQVTRARRSFHSQTAHDSHGVCDPCQLHNQGRRDSQKGVDSKGR